MKSINNPHVVYIITKLELGGAQKICLALMKHFSNNNNSSSLISGDDGPLMDQARSFSSTYFLPFFRREIGIKNIFNEVRAFFSIIFILRRLKKKYKNIIVHTHSSKAGIIGRWAAFFSRIPYRVHTIHGFGFHDHQSKITWSFIYALEYITSLITTHFICVSSKDQATGIALFPGFEKKSSIIRASVDEHYFHAATTPSFISSDSDNYTIGTISCFKPQKNIFDLLKAFHMAYEYSPQSMRRNLRLDIIGDGQLRSEIEAWILKRRLCNHIRLLGWQKNIQPSLSTWNVFALSSLWEGLPCSIVEARLNHLAVVAYNVGGINEIIQDNVNGFLIPPGDWQLMAQRLLSLITHPQKLQSLQTYPDELNSFSMETMNQQHKSLYTKITSKPL